MRRVSNLPQKQGEVVSAYMHGKVSHDHGDMQVCYLVILLLFISLYIFQGHLANPPPAPLDLCDQMGSRLGVVVLSVDGEVGSHTAALQEAGKKLAMHVVSLCVNEPGN